MGHKNIKEDFIACCEFRPPRRMPALALGLEFDYCRVGTYRDMRTNVEMMVESQVRAVRNAQSEIRNPKSAFGYGQRPPHGDET